MLQDLLNQIKSPHDKEAISKAAQLIRDKMLEENKTLQETLELQDDLLEKIYSLGFGYYNQGKYKEATSLFYLLTGINPKSYKFIFGLASCFHQLGDYENAAHGYINAFILSPNNPLPVFYFGDTCLKVGEKEGAIDAFQFAYELCKDNEEYKLLKEKCLVLKESLVSHQNLNI